MEKHVTVREKSFYPKLYVVSLPSQNESVLTFTI